jgi:hypothetical protein
MSSSSYDPRTWSSIISTTNSNNIISTPPPGNFVNNGNNHHSSTVISTLGNNHQLLSSSSSGTEGGGIMLNQQFQHEQQQIRSLNSTMNSSTLNLNLQRLNEHQQRIISGGNSPSSWGYFLPQYLPNPNANNNSTSTAAAHMVNNNNNNFPSSWTMAAPHAPYIHGGELVRNPGVHIPFMNCNDPIVRNTGQSIYSHQQFQSAADSQPSTSFQQLRSPASSMQRNLLATSGISPVMAQKPSLQDQVAFTQPLPSTKATMRMNEIITKKGRKRSLPGEGAISSATDECSSLALVPPLSTPKAVAGLGGERRLSISFLNMGRSTSPMQTFGKSRLRIPDGLSGVHVMYSQKWKFEINYVRDPTSFSTVIAWSITNVASNTKITVQETTLQAQERQLTGKTVCNFAMKQAMHQRLCELNEILGENNPSRSEAETASLTDIINKLTPKHFIDGLLFFGLRHTLVHDHHNSAPTATAGT